MLLPIPIFYVVVVLFHLFSAPQVGDNFVGFVRTLTVDPWFSLWCTALIGDNFAGTSLWQQLSLSSSVYNIFSTAEHVAFYTQELGFPLEHSLALYGPGTCSPRFGEDINIIPSFETIFLADGSLLSDGQVSFVVLASLLTALGIFVAFVNSQYTDPKARYRLVEIQAPAFLTYIDVTTKDYFELPHTSSLPLTGLSSAVTSPVSSVSLETAAAVVQTTPVLVNAPANDAIVASAAPAQRRTPTKVKATLRLTLKAPVPLPPSGPPTASLLSYAQVVGSSNGRVVKPLKRVTQSTIVPTVVPSTLEWQDGKPGAPRVCIFGPKLEFTSDKEKTLLPPSQDTPNSSIKPSRTPVFATTTESCLPASEIAEIRSSAVARLRAATLVRAPETEPKKRRRGGGSVRRRQAYRESIKQQGMKYTFRAGVPKDAPHGVVIVDHAKHLVRDEDRPPAPFIFARNPRMRRPHVVNLMDIATVKPARRTHR